MAKPEMLLTVANKSAIITESTFSGYDFCINPYVGCQFGCKYCYVRFFIKDAEKPWGEFVRRREHLQKKLPKELHKVADKRVVFGTMTDPYQPEERKHRLTRAALQLIDQATNRPSKVGIFTRSPIVLDDASLISKLPKNRVHFSVTPLTRDMTVKIESIPIHAKARWAAIKSLINSGVRVYVNVAPAIPVISDALTEEYCGLLAESGVKEFFVDPMQAYGDSFVALQQSLLGDKNWSSISAIMTDKKRYAAWKEQYKNDWVANWKKVGAPSHVLAIWCDHVHKVWENMVTGDKLDRAKCDMNEV